MSLFKRSKTGCSLITVTHISWNCRDSSPGLLKEALRHWPLYIISLSGLDGPSKEVR